MTQTPEDRATAPPERWQHGAERIEGGRGRPEEVAKPVAALFKSGLVGEAEVVAADRFHRDYALSLGGATSVDLDRAGGGSPSPDAHMVATVDAMTGYREAVQTLGLARATIVYDAVIEGYSIRNLANGDMGRRQMAVRARLADALKALAEHYSSVDSRKGRRRGYDYA